MGEILQSTGEILIGGIPYQVSYINSEIEISGNRKIEVYTEIEVNPKNSFTAKYKLIAVGNADLETEIVARPLRESDTFTEIYSRALGIVDKDTYLNVMYRGNSDVLTEIQPIGYNNMPTEIEVRPHNRMWALYEVQQPPIITSVFNPVQDAFTREHSLYESINYGHYSSMVVGRSVDDIWRSFVQFDLSFINPSYVLTNSYLRLYYKGVVPETIRLEVLNADSAWQEHNITNLNRPAPIDLITSDFTVNEEERYVEFNVLDIVESWIALKQINNGFIIRFSNETEYGQVTFNTRETALPPELVVEYYDSRIFSQGRSQHITEIFVFKANSLEAKTEITVDSAFSFSTFDTEIYVHRVEVPLESDIGIEITISKPKVYAEIIATIRKDDDIKTEISIRNPLEHKVDAEFFVSRPKVNTEIYVRHNNDTLAEIIPRAIGSSNIDTYIISSRPVVNTEITPAYRDSSDTDVLIIATRPDVLTEIIAVYRDKNDIYIEIEANSFVVSKINTEILISKENIKTEIVPRVLRLKDLYTIVSATRPEIQIEVEVKSRSEIWVEIEPNIKSDVVTEIVSNKPVIHTEIAVNGYEKSSNDVELFVSYTSEIHTEIESRLINQVHAEIDIVAVSQLAVEITVTKKIVYTEIVIPTWVDFDILATIEPRITMVSNIYTRIQVGSVGGAYAFII